MALLAIDAGTTHCKAGLFDEGGRLLALASRPTPHHKQGTHSAYDPQALWESTVAVIREVLASHTTERVTGVGLSSMAETGLLISPRSSEHRTHFVPWFDTRTIPQAESIAAATDVAARFLRTGMRPTFKCAVARLLWWREQDAALLEGAIWLSVADYLAYRLSGALATDYSLANRTYAFSLREKAWDHDWLHRWKLDSGLFPRLLPAGAVAGGVTPAAANATGIPAGASVTIAGHDHVCAAFAAGATTGGVLFDSMGTAETLVGAFAARALSDTDYRSGFTFGRQLTEETYYWMGGLSTSGGAVEWLRSILAGAPLSYEALDALLDSLPDEPTGILFLPYLAGSGSPHSDDRMPAVFAGLRREHGRAHLVRAVLEGAAYEMEWIRRAAQELPGVSATHIVAGGGGTRNRRWLQIKADISGLPVNVLSIEEATLRGAALLAGVAAGVYADAGEALAQCPPQPSYTLSPHPSRHTQYRRLFEEGYCRLQQPLRQTLTRLSR